MMTTALLRRLLAAAMLLCVAVAGLPTAGEEDAMLVDEFVARAHIEADDALRERIGDFLKRQFINSRILGMMDDALVARYAAQLAADLPMDYRWMLEGETIPPPADADFGAVRQVAVVRPQSGAAPSFVADFDIGRYYSDPEWATPTNVCRARNSGALTDADRDAVRDILAGADVANWAASYAGQAPERPTIIALAFDAGVVRCAIAGRDSGAPEALMNAIDALMKWFDR